jgi:hypothetical protein
LLLLNSLLGNREAVEVHLGGRAANVSRNINGGALGIFGSYTVSRQSVVLKEEHGFPQRPVEP